MAYHGEANANSANVVYPFATALPAAQAVVRLARDLESVMTDVDRRRDDVVVQWRGPEKERFELKVAALRGNIATVAAALDGLGDRLAASWAAARGQQDRINRARYVEWDIAQDSLVENAWEFFAGETDYGPPPADPPTPTRPAYEITRSPLHTEFGP